MIISLPLFIDMPRKTMKPRRYYINLNAYRNWNFMVSNNIKKSYKDIVRERLLGVDYSILSDLTLRRVKLSFTLFKATNRKIDRANVLSITEKFFCDALVELGFLVDDNDDCISETVYRSGGVDKLNPRVEVEIL